MVFVSVELPVNAADPTSTATLHCAASGRVTTAKQVSTSPEQRRIVDLPSGCHFISSLIQPFDNILILRQPDFALPRTVHVVGQVQYPGTYTLTAGNERLVAG